MREQRLGSRLLPALSDTWHPFWGTPAPQPGQALGVSVSHPTHSLLLGKEKLPTTALVCDGATSSPEAPAGLCWDIRIQARRPRASRVHPKAPLAGWEGPIRERSGGTAGADGAE